MGIFNKIKNILFEDDEEGEMPVYTKEDKSVNQDKSDELPKRAPIVNEDAVAETREVRFKAPKAEMDYKDDILDEVVKKDEIEIPSLAQKEVEPVVKENKSPFLSFDEEEFERLNSRIISNEKAARNEKLARNERVEREENKREEVRKVDYSEFQRKANNNVSATNPTKDSSRNNPNRYKIDDAMGRKPFKPSPVISPVYGILDKNYKVDDIVDKKDGIKREVNKPPVREEISSFVVEEEVPEENDVISIDSVRNKAFGAMVEMEKDATKKIEEQAEDDEIEMSIVREEETFDDNDDYVVSNDNSINTHNSLDDLVSQHFDSISETEDTEENDYTEESPRELDDMEKTSTLQILDDIEKELNSIKPLAKNDNNSEDMENDEELKKDGSLENDLFNLIDSMYEEGEEDSND